MKKLRLLAHQILIHYIILSERHKYRMIKETSLSVSFYGDFQSFKSIAGNGNQLAIRRGIKCFLWIIRSVFRNRFAKRSRIPISSRVYLLHLPGRQDIETPFCYRQDPNLFSLFSHMRFPSGDSRFS